jgi:hypothetical protein
MERVAIGLPKLTMSIKPILNSGKRRGIRFG